MTSFGSRLETAFGTRGRLCVGIDPHGWLLEQWGLPDSAGGAREMALRVVEAATGRVGIVKPQVAFFERFGAAGYAVLEEVLAAARSAELLVIADAKRGDIGSSVDAYGRAWLTPGGPLEADAMTVNAFQGVGSLHESLQFAEQHGKGLFLLAATSNPEAATIQLSRTGDGRTVSASIAGDVVEWNSANTDSGLGSMGVVLGATLDLSHYGISLDSLANTPILAPGFGHQGAHLDAVSALFGPAAGAVIVSVSRSVLAAGPDGIVAAIELQSREAE